MTTMTKGAAHKAWLDDLRNRPREEAAKLVKLRHPDLTDEEVHRRLPFLDAAPVKPAKLEPVQLPKDVADARKAARKAAVKSGRLARQQHALELRLAAEARKARRDEPRR